MNGVRDWIVVHGYDLSVFGIKSYGIIRAIHDQHLRRDRRSISDTNVHRRLILQLDNK